MIQGGGFNADATVRLEALTPDLGKVLDTIYVHANWIGYLDANVYLDNLGGYIGNGFDGGVSVVAEEFDPYGPEIWAVLSQAC